VFASWGNFTRIPAIFKPPLGGVLKNIFYHTPQGEFTGNEGLNIINGSIKHGWGKNGKYEKNICR
jgi:hypothetical protein